MIAEIQTLALIVDTSEDAFKINEDGQIDIPVPEITIIGNTLVQGYSKRPLEMFEEYTKEMNDPILPKLTETEYVN